LLTLSLLADGNGEISLAELLHAADELRKKSKTIIFLCVGLVLLVLGIFMTSIAGSAMAQNTEAAKGALAAKGSTAIVATAVATESVPLVLSPLLGATDLQRVSEVVLSNFMSSDGTPCAECPQSVVLRIQAAEKMQTGVPDTVVRFNVAGSGTVTIDKGEISVSNLPGIPASSDGTMKACGKATCSSIRIGGMNIDDLKKRAQSMGFTSTGRRFLGSICDTGKSIATAKVTEAARIASAEDDEAPTTAAYKMAASKTAKPKVKHTDLSEDDEAPTTAAYKMAASKTAKPKVKHTDDPKPLGRL